MPNNHSCLRCGAVYPNLEIESTLFLVRHGETDWNKIGRIQGHMDTPLNEMGIAQAKATAEQFCGEHINFIISSDLARAKQTGEIIAEAIRLEIGQPCKVCGGDFYESERGRTLK